MAMDYGIQKLRAGAGGLAKAMLGAAGVRDAATADELAALQQGRYQAAKAREADAAAAIEEDRRAAIQGLEGVLGPVMGAIGLDPSAAGSYAGLLRAGGGNASQVSDALTGYATGARQQGAVDAFRQGERDLGNFMLAASGRTPYTPYAQNAAGSVLNEGTGAVDQSNPLAQGNFEAIMAQAYERAAGARQADATANLRGLEGQTEAEELERVKADAEAARALAVSRYTDAFAPGGSGGGGGAEATAQARKQRELEAQGIPPPIARAAAYGQLTYRQDPIGLAWELIDPLSQAVVARRDSSGEVQWNKAYFEAAGATAPAGTSPSDPDGIRGLLFAPGS